MQIHRLSEELRPLLKFYAVHPKVRMLDVSCLAFCVPMLVQLSSSVFMQKKLCSLMTTMSTAAHPLF